MRTQTQDPMNLDTLDMDGRDLAWLAVLGRVVDGPADLGEVVAAVERALFDVADPRSVSAHLQEMARGNHITLASDGRRWRVSLGPRGLATLGRLTAQAPHPLAPGLGERFRDLCRGLGLSQRMTAEV